MELLTFAILAMVISLVAGALGFSGLAAGAASVAKFLFAIFLVIALVLFALVMFGVGVVTAVT